MQSWKRTKATQSQDCCKLWLPLLWLYLYDAAAAVTATCWRVLIHLFIYFGPVIPGEAGGALSGLIIAAALPPSPQLLGHLWQKRLVPLGRWEDQTWVGGAREGVATLMRPLPERIRGEGVRFLFFFASILGSCSLEGLTLVRRCWESGKVWVVWAL